MPITKDQHQSLIAKRQAIRVRKKRIAAVAAALAAVAVVIVAIDNDSDWEIDGDENSGDELAQDVTPRTTVKKQRTTDARLVADRTFQAERKEHKEELRQIRLEQLHPKTTEQSSILAMFPRYNQEQLMHIANNTFDPQDLHRLRETSSSKVPKSCNITSAVWSEGFLIWFMAWNAFNKHHVDPTLVIAIIEFHNSIVKLGETYQWHEAVLPLATVHHRTCLQSDTFTPAVWSIPLGISNKYTQGKTVDLIQ